MFRSATAYHRSWSWHCCCGWVWRKWISSSVTRLFDWIDIDSQSYTSTWIIPVGASQNNKLMYWMQYIKSIKKQTNINHSKSDGLYLLLVNKLLWENYLLYVFFLLWYVRYCLDKRRSSICARKMPMWRSYRYEQCKKLPCTMIECKCKIYNSHLYIQILLWLHNWLDSLLIEHSYVCLHIAIICRTFIRCYVSITRPGSWLLRLLRIISIQWRTKKLKGWYGSWAKMYNYRKLANTPDRSWAHGSHHKLEKVSQSAERTQVSIWRLMKCRTVFLSSFKLISLDQREKKEIGNSLCKKTTDCCGTVFFTGSFMLWVCETKLGQNHFQTGSWNHGSQNSKNVGFGACDSKRFEKNSFSMHRRASWFRLQGIIEIVIYSAMKSFLWNLN